MAKKAKIQKELTLEQILWNCRDILRGKVEKADNRNAVLSLTFLKFAGDKFEERKIAFGVEQKGKGLSEVFINKLLERTETYSSMNVFFLQPHCRWAYIVEHAADTSIANILDTAMADIEKENAVLEGALPQRFFTSLRGVDSKSLKALIDEINKISPKRFHEKDLIGRVYEYFLQEFSIDERKEKGEFYTPKCIVDLIAELIEPFTGTIYDPCCGSGGMFVQSLRFVEAHGGITSNINVYGQESTPSTFQLAKMNLAIRGISHNLGRQPVSSFTDDQHKEWKFDFIMANPPLISKNGGLPMSLLPTRGGADTPLHPKATPTMRGFYIYYPNLTQQTALRVFCLLTAHLAPMAWSTRFANS